MSKFYYSLFAAIAVLLLLAFAILSYIDRTMLVTTSPYPAQSPAPPPTAAESTPYHRLSSAKRGTSPPPAHRENTPNPLPSLNLRLVGTSVFGEKSSAVIEDRDRSTQGFYRLGDTIKGFTVSEIRTDGVTLTREDREVILTLAARDGTTRQSDEFRQVGEDSWQVSADKITEMVSNLDQYAGQVIAYQHREDGNPAGFQIRHLKAGNDFEKMGIENGDIIKGVNGLEINSLPDVLKAVYQLSDDTDFVVEVERNSRPKELHYQLDGEVHALVPIIASMFSPPKR